MTINRHEGLGYECQTRLKESINSTNSVFHCLNLVFEYLPLAATVDDNIYCVHSGIGENLVDINEIGKIQRPIKIDHESLKDPQNKVVYEMLWSDPVLDHQKTENQDNEVRQYLKNKVIRFGTNRINEFIDKNTIQLIIRSHECVMNGA